MKVWLPTLALLLAGIANVSAPVGAVGTCALNAAGSADCNVTCAQGVTWTVEAGYSSASADDRIIGQLRCGTSGNWFALSSCTAKPDATGVGGHCEGPYQGTTSEDPAFCKLIVSDYPDATPVQDPFAICYDPADPSIVLHAVVEHVTPHV